MKRAIRMLTLIILILFFIYWRFFVSMDCLPKGELIFVSEAVNGNKINIYLCNGGATTSYAIRGELVTEDYIKNIYWQYNETRSEVYWISNEYVCINGIVLNIYTDVYDYRRN